MKDYLWVQFNLKYDSWNFLDISENTVSEISKAIVFYTIFYVWLRVSIPMVSDTWMTRMIKLSQEMPKFKEKY